MESNVTNIRQYTQDKAVNEILSSVLGISFASAMLSITQEINALLNCFRSYEDISKQWPAIAIREQYKANPGQAVILHKLLNLHSENLNAIVKQINEEYGKLEITAADREYAASYEATINEEERELFKERITPKAIEAYCDLLTQPD